MFHALAAQITVRMPFAPGDPTAPVQGPPLPTVTVTAPTVPAPTVTVTAPPTPAPTMPGWASNGIAQGTQAASNIGVNQGAIYAAVLFAAGLCMALLAFKMYGSAHKGDVKLAGKQSAVAAIGSFWLAVALFIGAASVIGLAASMLRGVINV